MKIVHCILSLLAATAALSAPSVVNAETKAASPALTAAQIVNKVSESGSWLSAGAEVSAKAVVTDKGGKTRELAFEGKSRSAGPTIGKSVITFLAPADVAGMKFLQIQNSSSDDERFLYTPDLKRTRRIAGSNRADAFLGTDFSYADIDMRDLRQSNAVSAPDEKMGRFDCYRVTATPTNADAVYGKIDLWVRKDNFLPLKSVMYDKRSNLVKTLVAKEVQRHGDRWFVTDSRMTDHTTGRTTQLVLDKLERKTDIPLDTFSLRAIEKG